MSSEAARASARTRAPELQPRHTVSCERKSPLTDSGSPVSAHRFEAVFFYALKGHVLLIRASLPPMYEDSLAICYHLVFFAGSDRKHIAPVDTGGGE